MRQLILFLLLNSLFIYGNAQDNYWQQVVNYTIKVELNDENHSLKGNISIDYTNKSPDTLTYIWFHLWPNAYKNKETAYARQILDDAAGRKRWKDMKDKGSIEGIDFTVDTKKAQHEADPENIDIVKLLLPTPLQPGKKIAISTPFLVNIPTYSSRSGHIGNSYIICQWYPKPAVYDRKGWHPMPYLDQGEYYSEFGRFDVSISIPTQYVVGATGNLKTSDELAMYKQLGKENQEGAYRKYEAEKKTGLKTLRYTGENIHDFAWFADKNFIIRYDTAQLASGTVIDVFTYSYEKGNRNWRNSISYVEDAIRSYSSWVGEYPYPVAQAVEGPANVMSGGMEYPMITLITSPSADEPALDGVIAHEVGHNWFYGILASNEREHPWMDEGINTYYQFRYEAAKHKANSIFGNDIPGELRSKPVDEFLASIYAAISQIPIEDPIATPSEGFKDENSYAMTAYIKTALWMYIIEATVGKENLEKVMQSYYTKWKFRHPYPEDLKTEFETVLNLGFDDIFNMLNKKGGFD